MKKYLFGLGAMLVGAGLMFVLMHGEVSADANPEPCVCSTPTIGKSIIGSPSYNKGKRESPLLGILSHCHCGKLECVTFFRGGRDGSFLSCHPMGGILSRKVLLGM